MERYIVIALLVGMVIGAGSATALSSQPTPIAAQKQGTVWSAHHAAIQDDGVVREPAPTF